MDMLNRKVNVLNRSTGSAGYIVPDTGVHRNWSPGEIKKNISVAELEQATFAPGGRKLIQKYLVINDPEVCEYLGIETEPEYFYGEKEIKTLLETGTLDQLLDCLDFAPGGVIELVKKIGLQTKLNDIQKREAIRKATGFDITKALENVDYANSTEEGEAVETKKTRRSKPVEAEPKKPAGRRAAEPKYKRVAELDKE